MVAEVTARLAKKWCNLGEGTEEVVNEGLVVGEANNQEVDIMPDPVEVDFEDENGQDGASALDHTRTLKLEFDPQNVEFWFTQVENEMFTCQVKSQWLKRCVLVKNLPPKVQADVMSLLVLCFVRDPQLDKKSKKKQEEL